MEEENLLEFFVKKRDILVWAFCEVDAIAAAKLMRGVVVWELLVWVLLVSGSF